MRGDTDTRARGASGGYLPGLDGLRGIAVIAVLVFHGNAAWLPAGFLGVEAFFAISGYIITRGLLSEHDRTGRIDLRGFWVRRARRLLPAVALLVVALLSGAAVADPPALPRLRADALAAAGYVTNWRLVLAGESYFDSWSRPSLLKHLWSLAVEEQFYIAWPLALALLLRRGRGFALAAVVLGALGSTGLMALMYEPGSDVSRLYYGTDTRAAGFLAGAGAAIALPALAGAGRRAALAATVSGAAALALICVWAAVLDASSPFLYRGGFLGVSGATALVIAAVSRSEWPLSRVLGVAPLRWVGARSYGIYLWHWPLYLLTWPEGPSLVQAAGLAALAVAIAAASYAFLDEPVRKGALDGIWAAWRSKPGVVGHRRLAKGLVLAGFAPLLVGATAPLSTPSATGVPEELRAGGVRIMSPATDDLFGSAVREPAASTPVPVLPDRNDCASIRSTEYRSETERAWYLSNCIAAPAVVTASPAAVVSAPGARTSGSRPAGIITAIGDSVMLGAARELAAAIPGIMSTRRCRDRPRPPLRCSASGAMPASSVVPSCCTSGTTASSPTPTSMRRCESPARTGSWCS